jgi:RNA polymerase sigma-70 factor (ECF subfamily)
MADSPTTQFSLLVRIRDSRDAEAWTEFVDIYAPLVYSLARKHGLQDADAADLTQEVLRLVACVAPQFTYDPRRGSFRGWLFTVARNQVRKWANARKRQVPGTGSLETQRLLEEQPARDDEVAAWDQEYQQRLVEWAAEKVRDQFRDATWQAFWRTALEGQEPRAVGEALGMSVGAVYIARSRVLARIKELIKQVQDD